MLKKFSFIILFLFAATLYAATETVLPTTTLAQEKAAEPANVTAPAKVAATVSAKKTAPVKAPAPAKAPADAAAPGTPENGELYHFAYVPDEASGHETDYTKGSAAGRRGNFLMTFVGEGVFYKDYNKGTPGFGIEVGWQFNVLKYMSIVADMNVAYRRGYIAGDKFYPIGFKGALRFRVLPWFFPFVEGGTELIKIARTGWEPPTMVMGGGILIRMGAADKRAEYDMYKTAFIKRIMLVLAVDYTKVNHNTNIVPRAYIFKGGMSFEF